MDRRVLVIRHGERCDNYFKKRGINWIENAFDAKGTYTRFHPQLPESLPFRGTDFVHFSDDTPITERGFSRAVTAGELFRTHEVDIDFVYSSPSLRCVQTAQGILKGLNGKEHQIRIEPGLFQWMHWCKNGVPQWITADELAAAGFSIDTSYSPIDNARNFDLDETLADYYNRSFALMKNILKEHDKGKILLVAHAGSLDTLTRQLCGGRPLSRDSFSQFLHKTSYLSCNEIIELADRSWKNVGSPIPALFNSGLRG